MENKIEKLVAVKVFNSRVEAEVAKSFLENYGIKAFIRSDDAGGMFPQQQYARGVELSVEKSDLREAKKLLEKSDLL